MISDKQPSVQHLQDLESLLLRTTLLWALLIGRLKRRSCVFIWWIPLQQDAPLPQAVAQLLSVPGADGPPLHRQAGQRRESRQSAEQRRQPGRAGSGGQRSQAEVQVLQTAQAFCCEEGGPTVITDRAVVGQIQHPQRGQTATSAHGSCTGQR